VNKYEWTVCFIQCQQARIYIDVHSVSYSNAMKKACYMVVIVLFLVNLVRRCIFVTCLIADRLFQTVREERDCKRHGVFLNLRESFQLNATSRNGFYIYYIYIVNVYIYIYIYIYIHIHAQKIFTLFIKSHEIKSSRDNPGLLNSCTVDFNSDPTESFICVRYYFYRETSFAS